MTKIEFFVPGKAVAQSRPRFARRGAFVTTYEATPAKDYKSFVKMVAIEHMNRFGWIMFNRDIPLCVNISVAILKPKSKPKSHLFPVQKPDADNFCKLILDSLESICYEADQQVTSLFVQKKYASLPGVTVTIFEDTNPNLELF